MTRHFWNDKMPIPLLTGLIVCATFTALRAQAAMVTVTGEFSAFTADNAGSEATVTALGAFTPVTTSVQTGVATSLPAGTSKIDFKFSPNSGFITNSFEFTPGDAADVNRGDIFRLGSFTFTNGTWFDAIHLAFSLTTHSADSALNNQVFTGTMNLVVNPNVADDPFLSADYFFIVERPDLGSVRVFERLIQPLENPGFTGTAEFYGRIGSLIPTSFANPSGGAFISPSTQTDPAVVPEPGTLCLLAGGAAFVALPRRSKKRC